MSFLPYAEYKDSGVAWLGAVPGHWEVAALKRHLNIVGGSTPKSDVEAYWDGDIPWITPADLSRLSGFYINEALRCITEDGLASCGTTMVPAGSVILSTRAPIGSLGIAAVDVCTNQGCKALVPNDVGAKFLAYVLSICSTELNVRGRGSTFLELSGDELGAFQITFPPLAEQEAIAGFLDREVGKIDGLVAEQQRLIALLKEKRQAVISHAVTKGLNPNAPLKDSGIEWLGQIPAHWEVGRAKNLFRKSALLPHAKAEVVTCFRDGQVTLRRNRREDGFTLAILEVGYQGIRRGQLVLHSMDAFAGAIGVCDSEGKCSPEYLVCDPVSENINTQYYSKLLRLMALRGYILAMCPSVRERAPRIRFPDFGDMLLPLPPRSEQDTVVEAICVADSSIAGLMKECSEAITLLQERRAALISAAVTGKIDVRAAAERTAPNAAQVADLPPLRSLVGSYTILRFGKLGRMVIMKLGYLAEAHAGLGLGGHYIRDAAGPYDRNLRDAMEHGAAAVCGIATKEPTKDGGAVTYTIPSNCHAPHDELTALVGADRAQAFEAMLAHLKDLNRDNIEAIATLYAVWNDLLADGKHADDGAICAGVLNDWHPEKRAKFTQDQLMTWLDWMRRHGFVPNGTAPRTDHQGSLFA